MGATHRLDFTTPHALRNAEEYDAAAAAIDALIERGFPDEGTPEADRLEFLSALITAYDAQHVRFGADVPTTPQEAVEFGLQQHGLSRSDLANVMGGKSRVSEFFSGARPLSITQVAALRDRLGIPADLLIPRAAPKSTARSKTRKATAERGSGKLVVPASRKARQAVPPPEKTVGAARHVAKSARGVTVASAGSGKSADGRAERSRKHASKTPKSAEFPKSSGSRGTPTSRARR